MPWTRTRPPTYKVVEVMLSPEGVGTRARLAAKMLVLTEEVAIEFVEFVPDRRIVFEGRPTMTIAGRRMGAEVFTWTWTFEPRDGGTTLTVAGLKRGGSRLEHAVDTLFGTQRVVSKQFQNRLTRIKAAVEAQASAIP
jgi:hypothetical protein